MGKLFTPEDARNVHKSLGLIALLHFLYRLYEVAVHGRAFHAVGARALAHHVFCVSFHGLLSLSSFIPRVPTARNYTAPMIWPEFRAHNLVFCSRHVIATILALVATVPEPHRPECFDRAPFRFVVGAALVYSTSEIAEAITRRMGSKESRTTSAMPYPPWLATESVAAVKDFYVTAQFGAACSSCLLEPTYAFGALYGLQLSPFCMTLVRKGYISAATYHRVYSLALLVPYFMGARMAFGGRAILLLQLGIATTTVRALRVEARAPRWLVALVASALCCCSPLGWESAEADGPQGGPYGALVDALECAGTACAVVSLVNKAQIYWLVAEKPCRAVVWRMITLLVGANTQNPLRSRQECCPSAAPTAQASHATATDIDCRDTAHPASPPAIPRKEDWKWRLRASAAQLWSLARLGQVPTPVIVAGVLAVRGLCAGLS